METVTDLLVVETSVPLTHQPMEPLCNNTLGYCLQENCIPTQPWRREAKGGNMNSPYS